MAEQLSLFGSPEPERAPVKPVPAAASAQPKPAPEPVTAYASVVLDIPTRALSEPFCLWHSPVLCQRGADRIHGPGPLW